MQVECQSIDGEVLKISSSELIGLLKKEPSTLQIMTQNLLQKTKIIDEKSLDHHNSLKFSTPGATTASNNQGKEPCKSERENSKEKTDDSPPARLTMEQKASLNKTLMKANLEVRD